ncbi:hypothetical protein K7432_002002 [Basidiobolus ranarum]|uniref:Uncharacterized protein n=1 Tax=Basidiobolus ranarum TaxID=34480 RepID=A0ABR2X2G8_9FUNG
MNIHFLMSIVFLSFMNVIYGMPIIELSPSLVLSPKLNPNFGSLGLFNGIQNFLGFGKGRSTPATEAANAPAAIVGDKKETLDIKNPKPEDQLTTPQAGL